MNVCCLVDVMSTHIPNNIINHSGPQTVWKVKLPPDVWEAPSKHAYETLKVLLVEDAQIERPSSALTSARRSFVHCFQNNRHHRPASHHKKDHNHTSFLLQHLTINSLLNLTNQKGGYQLTVWSMAFQFSFWKSCLLLAPSSCQRLHRDRSRVDRVLPKTEFPLLEARWRCRFVIGPRVCRREHVGFVRQSHVRRASRAQCFCRSWLCIFEFRRTHFAVARGNEHRWFVLENCLAPTFENEMSERIYREIRTSRFYWTETQYCTVQ